MSLINRFDHSLTSYVQQLPIWLKPIMTSVSFLGEPVTVGTVVVFAALIARRQDQPRIVWAFGLALAALVVVASLKQFLHRIRPNTLYVTTMKFKSYSFPSGHAFGAAIIYGLLAYLAIKHLLAPWSYAAAAASSLLVTLIGLSRVYLGAHFPTDVVGGWLLGLLGLWLIVISTL